MDEHAVPFDELDEALAEADLVVSATASTEPVLTAARLAGRERPLVVLDLAVPRDVAPEVADAIDAAVGEAGMPRYAQPDGREKLSAAWLIERAGFPRGYPGEGAPARLSTKHTLALTNRGSATAGDIVALAREVRAGVEKRFGVTLEPEPVWVGVEI